MLEDIFSTVIFQNHSISYQVISDTMLAELKTCFLEAYDDNKDGKIDIREVSKALYAPQRVLS